MPATSPPFRAWQRMLSGRRLDLLDPSPLDVEIEDIARGLSRVARWNGQTTGAHPLSVAQHSLFVEWIFGELNPTTDMAWRRAALLHDAAEYVIGDMISPFKAVMGGDYKSVEARLSAAIHLRFSLPAELPAEIAKKIKRADRIAAYFEATMRAGFATSEAGKFFGRPQGIGRDRPEVEEFLAPITATKAERQFLQRFAGLSDENKSTK
ncbi:MAG: HD family hydrolase [Hyphomicrobiales bacterium]|nr:HD family hydrolase [Hyphomicrobiales bacterium]